MGSGREWWVGLMFFAALVTMIFVTVYLSDLTFTQGETLSVVFTSVKGLREGDDVNVAGMRVGKVRSIEFMPESAKVRVTMWLSIPVELREGYSIAVTDASLLGGTNVSVQPGPPDQPVVSLEGDLSGEEPVAMLQSLGRVVGDMQRNFGTILENVNAITDDLRAGRGTLGKLLSDDSLFTTLTAASKNLEGITAQLQEGDGTLGRLLQDGSVYDDLATTMEGIASLATDLREGEGTLSLLLRERKLYDDLEGSLEGFRKIATGLDEGEGTLGKLLSDSSVYDRVNEIVESLARVAEDLEAGQGTLGMLLSDQSEVQGKIEQIVDDIGEITARLRNGDGTLSRLLASNELHTEMLKTFQTVNGAIEDARESAPLNTFSAALFSAF